MMFILYFDFNWLCRYHAEFYQNWTGFGDFFASESAWLVPGTDPEDPLYVEP